MKQALSLFFLCEWTANRTPPKIQHIETSLSHGIEGRGISSAYWKAALYNTGNHHVKFSGACKKEIVPCSCLLDWLGWFDLRFPPENKKSCDFQIQNVEKTCVSPAFQASSSVSKAASVTHFVLISAVRALFASNPMSTSSCTFFRFSISSAVSIGSTEGLAPAWDE